MLNNSIFDIINKQSPHLGWIRHNTIFLVRHGSHAYGTNTPTSDEDFKGITIPPRQYFLGALHKFEQAELKEPDTVIYEIRKFFNLAAQCNPNIIEVLHTDPSDHILVDSLGEIILDHRNDFLSKKVKHTFLGYAVSQLKRMKSHKQWLMHPPLHPPTRASLGLPEKTLIPQDQLEAAVATIQKELDKFQFDFMDQLDEPTKIGIRSIMAEMLSELKISSEDQWLSSARKIGLSDNFIYLLQKEKEYTTKKREWEQYMNWKKNRNPARAALEEKYGYDAKDAYHLVRLIRMAKEILTTGKVIVKRPDREELLAIRNGAWTYDQIVEFADQEEINLNKIYNSSNILPNKPDYEKLDNLCIQLIEKSLSKYSWYNLKKSFLKEV